MRMLLAMAVLCGAAAAAPVHVKEAGFAPGAGGLPAGWNVWSAHAETAPRPYVDPMLYRGRPGSLAISGNSKLGEHGGWQRSVAGITPGTWYRFTAYYRAENVPCESWQVLARLDWRDGAGRRAGATRLRLSRPPRRRLDQGDGRYPAPPKAASAGAAVAAFQRAAGYRVVGRHHARRDCRARAAQGYGSIGQPAAAGTKSAAESVRQFVETVEKWSPPKTDVILLPEGITVIGTGKTYAEVAETIPGPTTAALAELAEKRSAYVAAGIYEREGPVLYNTAVLLDRTGELMGKYRKVYLPRGELEGGLTPGTSYPGVPHRFRHGGNDDLLRRVLSRPGAGAGHAGRGDHPDADLGRRPHTGQGARHREQACSWRRPAMIFRPRFTIATARSSPRPPSADRWRWRRSTWRAAIGIRSLGICARAA